jgi:hypothetical protein
VDGDPPVIRMVDHIEGPLPPPPIPDWFKCVIRIRRMIGDPVTRDYLFCASLPETGLCKTAYVLVGDAYNGQYNYYECGEWHTYCTKFSDDWIKTLCGEYKSRVKAALRLINELIAKIDPSDYILSSNAGGQSVSFPDLTSVFDYYERLKKALMEQDAMDGGMNSGLMIRARRSGVGGVWEEN